MDEEYFYQRMRFLSGKLREISERTARMAELRIANPDNPEFTNLMQQFDLLIKQSDELIDAILGQLKGR